MGLSFDISGVLTYLSENVLNNPVFSIIFFLFLFKSAFGIYNAMNPPKPVEGSLVVDVKTMAEWNEAVDSAKNCIVVVDFYADW